MPRGFFIASFLAIFNNPFDHANTFLNFTILSPHLTPVKKIAVMLLTFYAASMLCYGSLEIVHDTLHWLSAHHYSHLHEHEHDHHHSFQDHDHSDITANDTNAAEQDDLPILVYLFLYSQQKLMFQFLSAFAGELESNEKFTLRYIYLHPSTPPPRI